MKHYAVITDTSPQFGGEVKIICYSRKEAIVKARKECLEARSIGIKCYGKIEPYVRVITKTRVKEEFQRLGWIK